MQGVEHRVDGLRLDHGGLHRCESFGWQAMRDNAERVGVGAADDLAGEREIEANLPRHFREEIACPDIREKADAGLWHGETHILARDPVCPVKADAYAATHDRAVDESHIRLLEAFQRPDMLVLLAVEALGFFRLVPYEVINGADIAA